MDTYFNQINNATQQYLINISDINLQLYPKLHNMWNYIIVEQYDTKLQKNILQLKIYNKYEKNQIIVDHKLFNLKNINDAIQFILVDITTNMNSANNTVVNDKTNKEMETKIFEICKNTEKNYIFEIMFDGDNYFLAINNILEKNINYNSLCYYINKQNLLSVLGYIKYNFEDLPFETDANLELNFDNLDLNIDFTNDDII